MSTPYELIRLNFRPDKIRLNKIKILRSPNILITVILTLDTPPLLKLNFEQAADTGFIGSFQTLIHGYYTICMNNLTTL